MQISLLSNIFFARVVELIRLSDKDFSWSDKQILESLNKDLALGLFKNQQLLAVAIFSKIFETAELLYICVDMTKHNKGLGSKLLENSICYLSKQQIKEIFLEVDVNNHSAIKLYHKLNFSKISLRKNYYKKADGSQSDAIVYQLKI
ncbi:MULTISPECIES: GNAT family N-acetyltransferase [Francisella]|uniref:GNAT family N-acetyltransferase n=1 Tax=Francisella opportunistica TaxID=2016517 RepID=A0A345JR38_9GAMM|nr:MULTISPECIES: GNAT family N-acetyltransferase [Francisella]APC91503.1 Ribosomal-protein-S18p-alanine acetyltransferase [Francisella sp. MA067296]AXH29784.1 GNAT family N-acetyltransferase [Francisella opportunistica]AXH31434.1 alanine acetyltransferase [Francisella opportunistica]AXH33080.1 alanine acetyltransferase [Francisella opportunistica]